MEVAARARPTLLLLTALLLTALSMATSAASSFVDITSEPAGNFGGIDHLRYTGRFEGETSAGVFSMPFEIVAPADPGLGNRTVIVEPSHFAFGLLGRDLALGADLLFSQGFAHAGIGWSSFGLSILDPTAADLLLADQSIAGPAAPGTLPIEDPAIVARFTEALITDPVAIAMIGSIERRYAYGGSQTAETLLRVFHTPAGQGLFDLSVLHVAVWRPPFALPQALAELPEEFLPLDGIGRVVFVESEADQLIADSRQFRRAVIGPLADPDHYRIYEVAGAPHLPQPVPLNPLDHPAIARAALIAGDAWVRDGIEPPSSRLLAGATAGEVDPVYGFETGIARDADLNALGGVRLPDLEVGRALFVASLPVPGSGLFGLVGKWEDLACSPRPFSASGEPRFRNHGVYVAAVTQQATTLRQEGFLLSEDAEAIRERAAASEVGKPRSCPGS